MLVLLLLLLLVNNDPLFNLEAVCRQFGSV